MLLKNSCKRN